MNKPSPEELERDYAAVRDMVPGEQSRIAVLESKLATAQALLAKAKLPCLNCGRMRGKGDRLMTHDFKVYCDYDCAETDGEEWAQK